MEIAGEPRLVVEVTQPSASEIVEPESPVLLERDRELGLVEMRLDRSCGGAGSVVVIEGEAGSSKRR